MAQQEGPLYPDVEVRLIGEDGNAFSIIARVRQALRSTHGQDAAETYTVEAMAGTYEDLLMVTARTVTVL